MKNNKIFKQIIISF